MADPSIEKALARALVSLVQFVEHRPNDATEDDDVRALEAVAFELNQVAGVERDRLRTLLGPDVSFFVSSPAI